MEPHPRPTRRRTGLRALVACLIAAVAVSGCGLRLETPPPTEPVPDTLEIVRRTAVSDALYVADQAEAAVELLEGRRPRLTAELGRVARDAREHAEQLGGVYVSGLEPEGAPASPSVTPEEVAVEPQDVVETLVDAAGRSRTSASSTGDGDLARLLASIGAAQSVAAQRLGSFEPVTGPAPVVPVMPEPDAAALPDTATPGPDDDEVDEVDPGSDDAAAPDGTSTRAALLPATSEDEDDAIDEQSDDDAADAEDGALTTVPGSAEPPPVPRGLTMADLDALITSTDAAAYALRLRAARDGGDERTELLERSGLHAARSDAWAAIAAVDASVADPRQVAYAVPRDVSDAELVVLLEDQLAVTYASLVGSTAPDSRTVLVDLLVESALVADRWGAEPEAFPGLPELP